MEFIKITNSILKTKMDASGKNPQQMGKKGKTVGKKKAVTVPTKSTKGKK